MAKCTGVRCPMQYGYKVEECNHTDCPYRTEPITNADRIRAMSVEEMAEYFALDKHPSTPCYVCEYDNGLFCSKEDCNPDYKIKVFKEFLESEVQEDE